MGFVMPRLESSRFVEFEQGRNWNRQAPALTGPRRHATFVAFTPTLRTPRMPRTPTFFTPPPFFFGIFRGEFGGLEAAIGAIIAVYGRTQSHERGGVGGGSWAATYGVHFRLLPGPRPLGIPLDRWL